jgi:ribosomal protein RSM22 (predicted rRNA methylase)
MRLPGHIEEIIEKSCSGIPLATLAKHFQNYSAGYREGKETRRSLPSEIGKICYLATRFPATFGAVSFVLREAKRKLGHFRSLLDLGSGPGTTLLAAIEEGYLFEKAVLVEENKDFITMGKKWTPPFAEWRCADFLEQETFPSSELTVFAYSFGEVDEKRQKNVLKTAWNACQKALIIVEPGTPRAYKRLMAARDYLVSLGGHIAAPCPHNKVCPMMQQSLEDWCHFSVRIERSSLHRRVKGGDLGYEDEKFCYLVVAKQTISSEPRVIKTPKKNHGHIVIKICTDDGLIEKTISKKDGSLFKMAKKLEWGEAYCLEEE